MKEYKVKLKKVEKDAIIPHRSSEGAAGFDVYANNVKKVYLVDNTPIDYDNLKFQLISLKPNQRALIGTGIALSLPKGKMIDVRSRSGLSLKEGLNVVLGTIDEDYRGEIGIIISNNSETSVSINKDERIAQLIFKDYDIPYFDEVDDLDETDRGEKGFGSTGIK